VNLINERRRSLPLFERARIEVYLPDVVHPAYPELLAALEREFTFAFGGCTLVRDLEGSYLSRHGNVMRDRINLLIATRLSHSKSTSPRSRNTPTPFVKLL
jgi:hypothetical protein